MIILTTSETETRKFILITVFISSSSEQGYPSVLGFSSIHLNWTLLLWESELNPHIGGKTLIQNLNLNQGKLVDL